MNSRAALQNLADSVIERCHAGLDLDALYSAVMPRLRRAISVDATFFAVADPATLLHTRRFLDGFPSHMSPYYLENEFRADDAIRWTELARDKRGVRTLLDATGGRLEDSARHRDLFKPLGLSDEIRAVMRTRRVTWGYMCLARGRGSSFTSAETAFVTRVAPHLAEGIRGALLLGAVVTTDLEDAPGLVVVSSDGSTLSTSPPADRWLDELGASGQGLPHEIEVLVASVRHTAPTGLSAGRLHVRTRAGRWAVIHAYPMPQLGDDGAIAVIIEQAVPAQVAPIVMLAYGLTEQERTVTGLTCRGYSTQEIAEELHLSPHTVRDHLKSIFAKVGVGSGRELTAAIMQQQYLPRAHADTPLGPSGFYIEHGSAAK
jgi:DNA-binding CsgD family transcriptional regulator